MSLDLRGKWLFASVLALGIGGAIPLVMSSIGDESWERGLWGGMLGPAGVLAFWLFKRLLAWATSLKGWSDSSIAGLLLLIFSFSFLTSGMAAVFAILPFPHWLLILVGGVSCVSALLYITYELNQASVRRNRRDNGA